MTGVDLQQLLLEKWGRSYDIQLRRIKDKVHVQVMWKYLEQASFPIISTNGVVLVNFKLLSAKPASVPVSVKRLVWP